MEIQLVKEHLSLFKREDIKVELCQLINEDKIVGNKNGTTNNYTRETNNKEKYYFLNYLSTLDTDSDLVLLSEHPANIEFEDMIIETAKKNKQTIITLQRGNKKDDFNKLFVYLGDGTSKQLNKLSLSSDDKKI